MELLLEANSGIAGDMTIAALLDLGVTPQALEAELRKLHLEEPWTLQVTKVKRHGIVANHVSFLIDGKPIEGPYLASDSHGHHHHHHDHDHDHAHGNHSHAHGDHGHTHHPDHGPRTTDPLAARRSPLAGHGRHYAEIRKLILESGLAEGAKRRALSVFEAIGAAEAKLHGVTLDEVHFHEVGSLDAILDICGTAVCLDLLGVTRLYCLPLPIAYGNAKMAHGMLPLPAPATMEILKGFPVRSVNYKFETVTPTGAAIVAALAERAAPQSYSVENIGYGAGTKDPEAVANLLRAYRIRSETQSGVETICVLETTVDDATGEWTAHLAEALRKAGALDVFTVPVQMKKGRSGLNLTVLARPQDADRLSEICFLESPTIGVRRRTETRLALPRRAAEVQTPWGPVAVKVVRLPDGRERATPEFDSCSAVAARAGVPLLEVYRAAAAQQDF